LYWRPSVAMMAYMAIVPNLMLSVTYVVTLGPRWAGKAVETS
jgi:hypothetical protein